MTDNQDIQSDSGSLNRSAESERDERSVESTELGDGGDEAVEGAELTASRGTLPTLRRDQHVPGGRTAGNENDFSVILGNETVVGRLQNFIHQILPPDMEITERLDGLLDGARVQSPTDAYLARLFATGFLGALVVFVLGITLTVSAWGIGIPSVSPGLIFGSAVFLSGIVFNVIPLAQVFSLYSEVSSREREIDEILPHATSFMYTQAVGGANLGEIIQSVSASEKTYGEISREFQAIKRDIQFLGLDLPTAIERQADRTPSEELNRLLIDLISLIRSGGRLESFFEAEKEKAVRAAKDRQDSRLDTLEVASEFYLVLSFVPFGILILVVIMSLIQPIPQWILYSLVYIGVPGVGVLFGLGVMAMNMPETSGGYIMDLRQGERLSQDHFAPGSGRCGELLTELNSDGGLTIDENFPESALIPKDAAHPAADGLFTTPILDAIQSGSNLFTRVRRREIRARIKAMFSDPFTYFREHPIYTLRLTVPFTIAYFVFLGVMEPLGELSMNGVLENPFAMTIGYVYVPIFLLGVPIALFYEWRERVRGSVYTTLPSTLRKISSANESGMTFLESIESAVDTTENRLSDEFRVILKKTDLGVDLGTALIEFNNRYPSPDLARAIRLIEEAQKSTQDITDVLMTTIQTVEDRLELLSQQRNKTRIQMVYILVTNLMLLFILAGLNRSFVPLVAEGGIGAETFGQSVGGVGAGGSLDPSASSMLFLHAITVHAVVSGLLSGYVRTSRVTSGVKYVLALMLVIAVLWGVV